MEKKKNNKPASHKRNIKRKPSAFEILSSRVSRATGSTSAFIIALVIILTWLVTVLYSSFPIHGNW